LEIEPFGGTTFSVRSVPSVLDPGSIESIVLELAEQQAQTGASRGLGDILDQCRMVMACHKSIRANQRLTTEEIRALLAKLDLCQDPGHCPHGRPTWMRWSRYDLDKRFGRLG
jgi:DNA mismatch repair protein MutL